MPETDRATAYLGAGGPGRTPPALGDLQPLGSGKVRDLYRLDDAHLVFVTTDRISAFDVLMREGVPDKGRVLTSIAAWWFERTRDVVENHLVDTAVEELPGLDDAERARLRGRVLVVRRTAPTPVEWVVRAYLAGSGLERYRADGTLFGRPLPAGLELASRLPRPVLTPTTKDDEHDAPLSDDEARALVGEAVFAACERSALALFERATAELAERGVLLADTKFEFGLDGDRVLLIDEALTPDSSRFWPADAWRPGANPPSWDKQILRDWLLEQPWDRRPPAPDLDPAVVARLRARYLELCERLTGAAPDGV